MHMLPMNRRPHPVLLLFAILLTLPACFVSRSATNEPIDAIALQQLHPGESTARTVVETLGAPTEVVPLGKRTAYRYDAAVAKRAGLFALVVLLVNEDTRSDRVWLFFDEQDVLTHLGATFAAHRPQYAMPWEDIHEASDRQSADAARPGVGEGSRP